MSQAGGVAVGVQKITFMPFLWARSRKRWKKEKSKAPSVLSNLLQANSPIRQTEIPASSIRSRSCSHRLSGQCSG